MCLHQSQVFCWIIQDVLPLGAAWVEVAAWSSRGLWNLWWWKSAASHLLQQCLLEPESCFEFKWASVAWEQSKWLTSKPSLKPGRQYLNTFKGKNKQYKKYLQQRFVIDIFSVLTKRSDLLGEMSLSCFIGVLVMAFVFESCACFNGHACIYAWLVKSHWTVRMGFVFFVGKFPMSQCALQH